VTSLHSYPPTEDLRGPEELCRQGGRRLELQPLVEVNELQPLVEVKQTALERAVGDAAWPVAIESYKRNKRGI